ncbi:tRNA-uridine aminocarboxypropyltransferase [Sulfuricurvum sp.]|uniref:tRNA-uridine aminocarboxypropyltransferase n=1 Tax=Sulfuricurvum sp. TaxID=2025608 RepID=UPI002E345CA4|nr:tRNA-uridine aminocarboxypropyltransferase [Sulfuricurvum sp.]HEX5330234.1 tRNA-uridine aminocarboxypropyltransferase [Sulfuricurvum sp.]
MISVIMAMMNNVIENREKCYRCYRPLSSCMCPYVKAIDTKTKFVILMHPKEFKKTKNGTGRLTHLSLPNSELYIDVDFSEHDAINALIDNPQNLCYVLYPGKNALNINTEKIEHDGKTVVIFIIDSTWPCSVKMLRLSQNLQTLPKISFTHSKSSQFRIKEQPKEFCLSTIESTLTILELLNNQGVETIEEGALEGFLNPFTAMVNYQIECATKLDESVRFKKRREVV